MAHPDISSEKHGFTEKATFESTVLESDAQLAPAQTHDKDAIEMKRLGKAQEFNRNFSYISTMGFTSVSYSVQDYIDQC